MSGAGLAKSEQVFCGRIDCLNQEAAVDDDNRSIQALKDMPGPGWLSTALGFFFVWVVRFAGR